MSKEIFVAIEQIEKAKGIPKEALKKAIELALLSAYRKNFKSSHKGISVILDSENGTIRVLAKKMVVEKLKDSTMEISKEEARRLGFDAQVGEYIDIEITPKDFGRIAAQTAKQVILQRIREAERDRIYEEFVEKAGEIVTGIVNRKEGRILIVDLGRTEGTLPPSEQVPGEEYKTGDRMKFFIVDVNKTTKGPKITLSRTHPGLVKRLFELEVPEVHEGWVDVVSIAREPGIRSKVAVESRNERIDPVGSCIGNRGVRVKNIIDELKGEKIDIIRWSSDPKILIAEALKPAEVVSVELNEDTKTAQVLVPGDQLSLAIGKDGQNARLTARISGWRIDIKDAKDANREE
ncbi:MAG: transcription termination factor NusA [Candidatus Caldatribacteriaceae bacterium]